MNCEMGMNKEAMLKVLSLNFNAIFLSLHEEWDMFVEGWSQEGVDVKLPKDWNNVEWVLVCEIHRDDLDYFELLEFECHGDAFAIVVNVKDLV